MNNQKNVSQIIIGNSFQFGFLFFSRSLFFLFFVTLIRFSGYTTIFGIFIDIIIFFRFFSLACLFFMDIFLKTFV